MKTDNDYDWYLGFRSDIQGWRAIAVLAVFIFHTKSTWLPSGYIGVDIFFVISGFLITSKLLALKQKKMKFRVFLKEFYFGRIIRILPVYYFFLIIVTIFATIILLPDDFNYFKDSLKSALLFRSNNYFAFADYGNYFAPAAEEQPLLHTWSLAIEMQFYLLYPFLIFSLGVERLKYVIPLIIISLTAFVEYQINMLGLKQIAYYGLFCRIPEFLSGAIAVLYLMRKPKSSNITTLVCIFIVLLSFAVFDSDSHVPGLSALIVSLAVAYLIGAPNETVKKILSFKVLVIIGAWSYSLYLWHWMLLVIVKYVYSTNNLVFSQILVVWVLSFIFSYLSYNYIEENFRKKKNVKYTGIVIFVISLAIYFRVNILANTNKEIADNLDESQLRYANSAEICHGRLLLSCFKGKLEGYKKEVLVIGDSHAAMLDSFFEVVGLELNVRFEIITASSCLPIVGFKVDELPEWAQMPCAEQIKVVSEKVKHNDLIVLGGYWQMHLERDDDFFEILNMYFKNIESSKKFFVLADVPNFSSHNPARSFRLNQFGFEVEPKVDIDAMKINRKVRDMAENHIHVEYIDLVSNNEIFDNIPFYKTQVIYFDEHHLNQVGAKLYGKSSINRLSSKLLTE